MNTTGIPKLFNFVLLFLLSWSLCLISTACTTAQSPKDEPAKVIYETDFSMDDGAFTFDEGEINALENGVLHLKKGDKEVAHASLDRKFGNNSTITFRIKFGSPIFAHLNFLQIEGDRLLLHVTNRSIQIHSFLQNQDSPSSQGIEANLIPDRWYEFSIQIIDYNVTVKIDGELSGTAEIDKRLPLQGGMSFECHEEYWIDNLKILEETGGTSTGEDTEALPFTVKYEEIGGLLTEWQEAIRNRDNEQFARLLWPNTSLEFEDRKGWRTDFHGMETIREFRFNYFTELGPLEEYHLPEPDSYEDHNESSQSYGFRHKLTGIYEWLHFAKRDGIWKIQHIELGLPTPGSWVTNRFQALGDQNMDGFLQGEEHEFLYTALNNFLDAPHAAVGVLDQLFDIDGSGYNEKVEILAAGENLFFHGFRWFREFMPGWANSALDLNGDDRSTDDELELVSNFMMTFDSNYDPWKVRNELDRWMDRNEDGQVNMNEIKEAREYFIHLLIQIPCPPAPFKPVPRKVSDYLDELADSNGDGQIDKKEQEIIINSLGPYHEVTSYLDNSLDLQHDGKVNHTDVLLVLQASALGKELMSDKADPPFPVVTPTDQLLDRSGDRMVDLSEIENVAGFLAGDTSLSEKISTTMRDLADWNHNGRFEPQEFEETMITLGQPHPVNKNLPLDIQGDINRDGFIDPEELGITAGVTEKGQAATLEERIGVSKRQTESRREENVSLESGPATSPGEASEGGFQSDYYNKLGKIQDKKLAIISLSTETAHVDKETASGIIVFVENAFVNVGKVRVVDRKHIESILEEYKFQSSALVDENTAIEIGKLSGADIIVLGSINRVGEVFYLNIKLIDVKTAEIIGSNISQAKDASGFLDMCNQVVYMLF